MKLAVVLTLSCGIAGNLLAQPKRILYITHSAGYRHDSLPVSADVMRSVASASGKLEVTATEDVSLLNAATLRSYDAVFFFTSGDLPMSDQQKRELLEFVRSGKGFAGAHSATDTFYGWPEYGDLIGAYFNGHPWVQPARMIVEDASHPASAHLAPGWTIQEEFYQFKNLSRDRVRVLMRLDTTSVDLNAKDVNPGTDDFPVAWVRNYGSGRVFYTALGHFEETWRDPRFQQTLLNAMLWITGQVDGDATPRALRAPKLTSDAVANAASFAPRGTISPGSIITMFGQDLSDGSTEVGDPRNLPAKLAGASLLLNNVPASLYYASPTQLNAYVPFGLPQIVCITTPCPGVMAELTNSAGNVRIPLEFAQATPGIFVVTSGPGYVTFWATGLGPVERRGTLDHTTTLPDVTIGGAAARVLFSGLAPGWPGLYQVNVEVPPGQQFPFTVYFRLGGFSYRAIIVAP